MNILIIDGQGGGIGRALTEKLRAAMPDANLLAVGANAIATSAMLRAGATAGATGENAVIVCSAEADIIAGPIAIVLKDALMGEITAAMAGAVATSKARKVLIPSVRCNTYIAGTNQPLNALIEDAVERIVAIASQDN